MLYSCVCSLEGFGQSPESTHSCVLEVNEHQASPKHCYTTGLIRGVLAASMVLLLLAGAAQLVFSHKHLGSAPFVFAQRSYASGLSRELEDQITPLIPYL